MIRSMPSERLARVLALAAELPQEERVELARELVRSLPDEFDVEIERRLDEIDDETAELISWKEARAAILRD